MRRARAEIAILTDSMACIPAKLVEQYDIHVIPVYVIFGQHSFRDGVDLTAKEFYRLLRGSETLPTTAAPSVGDFLELFTELGREAEAIVAILIARELSATIEAAQEAARESTITASIHIIDSRTTAMAQGFIVLEAARAAAAGQGLAEVIRRAEETIPKVNLIAALDTLEYLHRGGRVPAVAALVGSLLQIKPIIYLQDGKVGVLERPRTKALALQRLVEIMADRIESAPVHAAVIHGNVPDEAEKLRAEIASRFDCGELYVTELTPVLGAHGGPGVIGLVFYQRR